MSDCAFEENKASEIEQKQDDASALFVLGMRYSTGRDVEHDLVTAHKWFNLAAMMGHEEALSARAELAREMSAGQIAEAQREARAWLWNRKAPAEPKKETGTAVTRPIYVRRRAQAMRSAKTFARVVSG
jgi:hypothetical protein